MIRGVVFDLDGVLVDAEPIWEAARRSVALERGGRWDEEAAVTMTGMSSPEWAAYLHDELEVPLPPGEIVDLVLAVVLEQLGEDLPLLPGAREAVQRMAARWPVALASSANRAAIDAVLAAAGIAGLFTAMVSSEEVPRGKPAPDVYLEATRLLGQPREHCAAVEDSTNGLASAMAAGLRTVAIPNLGYPADPAVVARAELVIHHLDELTVEALERLGGRFDERTEARLDEQEDESFPASDPHSDWAGPPG